MRIGMALRELHRSENDLAVELLRVADRHRAEHEVHHVARDLARWSQEHVGELTETGHRYGLELGSSKDEEDPEQFAEEQGEVGELPGEGSEPALLLLADLKRLHRMAAGVSLDWELLGQGAQAVADTELLALTKRCHPQTLRQMKWANAILKAISPQVLTS